MENQDQHIPEEKTEIQLLTEQVVEQSKLIAEISAKIVPPPPPQETTHQKYKSGLAELLKDG